MTFLLHFRSILWYWHAGKWWRLINSTLNILMKTISKSFWRKIKCKVRVIKTDFKLDSLSSQKLKEKNQKIKIVWLKRSLSFFFFLRKSQSLNYRRHFTTDIWTHWSIVSSFNCTSFVLSSIFVRSPPFTYTAHMFPQ